MSSAAAVRVTRRHEKPRARPSKPQPADFVVLRYGELTRRQRQLLHRLFQREILPALTPMALDPGHPFPRLSNRSISLAVMLKEPGHEERFGSLTVPKVLPRLWRIPGQPESPQFVRLEEMVAANIDSVFPGLEILSTSLFRVTRKAGTRVGETGVSNRPPSVRIRHNRRRFDDVLRLEVERSMPRRTRDLLIRNLGITPDQAVTVDGPLRRR